VCFRGLRGKTASVRARVQGGPLGVQPRGGLRVRRGLRCSLLGGQPPPVAPPAEGLRRHVAGASLRGPPGPRRGRPPGPLLLPQWVLFRNSIPYLNPSISRPPRTNLRPSNFIDLAVKYILGGCWPMRNVPSRYLSDFPASSLNCVGIQYMQLDLIKIFLCGLGASFPSSKIKFQGLVCSKYLVLQNLNEGVLVK